ncbi:TMEM43 family protein [Lysobacter korlensis]|uniref:TMEM43 family protein n=1 Tax=Lysobacter korlensis TaxID=553636 RepID=A0ABV6RPP1_9GAMM
MRWAGLALGLCIAASAPAAAPSAAPVDVEAQPQSGGVLRDREFGVRSDQFGLERRVEMYQWRRIEQGFQPVWNAAPIDSTGFPPEYGNPPKLPIESERWWAKEATLAGRPIHREVLSTLGRWVEFRPDFARLPANLAAAFQPEGNGLGSSENPLEPGIGDLRIRWHELVLPELEGRVELRDGTWRLAPDAVVPGVAPADPLVVITPPNSRLLRDPWAWMAGTFAIVLMLVAVLYGRRDRGDD